MALPLAHSLVGFTLYDLIVDERGKWSLGMICLFIFIANLPDLDVLPGLLVGDANKFHRHYLSHSIGASMIFGALIAAIFSFLKQKPFMIHFFVFSCVCFSHVIIDFLNEDTRPPFGVPMFWPFTSEYIISPKPIFFSVHKIGRSDLFFQSVFLMQNFWVALREIVIIVPILTLVRFFKMRKQDEPNETN